jgi:hypothetical protein
MTMAIDNQQRQFGGIPFDHMPYSNAPHFTNPWVSTSTAAATHSLYAPSHNHLSSSLGLEGLPKQQARVNNVSMPYGSVPTSASAGSPLLAEQSFGQQDLLTMSQDLMNTTRMQTTTAGYDGAALYASSASPVHNAYAPSSTPYDSMGYAPAPVRSTFSLQQPPMDTRRLSQPSVPTSSYMDLSADLQRQHRQNSLIDLQDRGALSHESTRSFGDAIDASRNIYGPNAHGRGSADSYGFPATHSTSSSISSSSTYPSYFGGSVDSSVSEYSNAGSDIESVTSRTLPRPNGLLNGSIPPAPQSMMGQFSSKVSSSTQKKHKCKVCDKRFTRPSSLQTHMYSHTGEKRKSWSQSLKSRRHVLTRIIAFSCEVEGCGRHFSVVSNLRRHRKVHKGEARSDAGSEKSDD